MHYWHAHKSFVWVFLKRALVFSLVLHATFLIYRWSFPAPEVLERSDAIEITLEPLPEPVKQKVLAQKSDALKSEPVKTPPQEKVISGTQKVVPQSKTLGNPTATKVQEVQKGDPMSKVAKKYEPGTEFRKLKATNIGSGASGSKMATANPGGSGDVYQGPDFAVKSLTPTALQGARFKVKSAEDDFGAGAGITGGIGDGQGRGGSGDGTVTGTPNGTLEKAKILNNMGSLTGTAAGAIGVSKGAQGLSTKGQMMMAGIPQETVVLGSLDPNLIRQILLDHLAQFRYCYQKELEDREEAATFAGVIILNFVIGASGDVRSTRVEGVANLTSDIRSCVSNVLKGIHFPRPLGGGQVEVRQPMNFYPRKY